MALPVYCRVGLLNCQDLWLAWTGMRNPFQTDRSLGLQEINRLGLKYELDIREFDEDWFEYIMNNQFRRAMEDDD